MPIDRTRICRGLRLVMVLAGVAGRCATAIAGDSEDAGRVRRAISYLEARQEAWSRFAKAERGQGTDKTTCVSCHTGISYTLVRPALGRFVGERDSTKAEERIRAAVRLRVEHWTELASPRFRLMYDFDDRKKVESRGTEAVLNALILAHDDAERGRATIRTATRAALREIWAAQAKEGSGAGSWDWLNFGLEPWEAKNSRAFGASLAAIAVGSAPGYLAVPLDEKATRGVTLLRDYLRRRFPDENLYNRLWILEASTRLPGVLSAEQKQDVVKALLAVQHDDGGWSLNDLGHFQRVDGTEQADDSDGYATGLVLHGVTRAGLPATHEERIRGLRWIRSHQQKDGSWPGRSLNKERDPATFVGKLMTDAATAFAALSLVEAESR